MESAHFKEQDNPELVDRIVEAICDGDADPSCRLLALVIAEQHIFLARVRAARVAALEHIFDQLAKTESAKPSASSDSSEKDTDCAPDHERQKENGNERGDETGNKTEDKIIIRQAYVSIICISEEFQSRMAALLQGSFEPAIKILKGTSSVFRAINKMKAMRGKQVPELKRVALREKLVRLTKSLNDVLNPPSPDVSSLDRAWAQLAGLERYEHRALSKRRRAIRRLAELRN